MQKYDYVCFFQHDHAELPLSLENRKTIADHFGVTAKRIDQKFRQSSIICRGSLCFERFPAEKRKEVYELRRVTQNQAEKWIKAGRVRTLARIAASEPQYPPTKIKRMAINSMQIGRSLRLTAFPSLQEKHYGTTSKTLWNIPWVKVKQKAKPTDWSTIRTLTRTEIQLHVPDEGGDPEGKLMFILYKNPEGKPQTLGIYFVKGE